MFWWKQAFNEFMASAAIRSTELPIQFVLEGRSNGFIVVKKRWQRSRRGPRAISLGNLRCAPGAAVRETCISSMVYTTVTGVAFLFLRLRPRFRATKSAADTFR